MSLPCVWGLWDGGSPLCQTCQSAGEFEKYRAGPHCQQRHQSLWGWGPTVSVSTTLCFWISGGCNVQPRLRGTAVNIRDAHCPPPARLTLNTLGFSGDTGCREVSFLPGAGTWAGCSLCLPKGQAELPAARTAPTTTKATLALLLAREAPWLIPKSIHGESWPGTRRRYILWEVLEAPLLRPTGKRSWELWGLVPGGNSSRSSWEETGV